MAKEKLTGYVAEPEHIRDKKWRFGIDGFRGVDADVPKTVVETDKDGRPRLKVTTVRMAPPRGDRMQVTTTGGKQCSDELARLRAFYKLRRSAFQFSPDEDKEANEKAMNIAFHQMQYQAAKEQLAAYEADPKRKGHAEVDPRQVRAYKRRIAEHRGELAELTGQEV